MCSKKNQFSAEKFKFCVEKFRFSAKKINLLNILNLVPKNVQFSVEKLNSVPKKIINCPKKVN